MKSDISGSVCFKRDDFHLYVFLLFVVIIYLLYILKNSKGYDVRKKESYTDVDLNSNLTKNELVNKINKLQDDLFTCQTSKQKCMIDLQKTQNTLTNSSFGLTENVIQRTNLNKIYNPLISPGRSYVSKIDNSQSKPGENIQKIDKLLADQAEAQKNKEKADKIVALLKEGGALYSKNDLEIIDLNTLIPWDKEIVIQLYNTICFY